MFSFHWSIKPINYLLSVYKHPCTVLLCLDAQLFPTLWDLMDCNPPGSSVHGDSPGKNTGLGCYALLQGSSQPRHQTQVSHIAGRFFTIWATKEAHCCTRRIQRWKKLGPSPWSSGRVTVGYPECLFSWVWEVEVELVCGRSWEEKSK